MHTCTHAKLSKTSFFFGKFYILKCYSFFDGGSISILNKVQLLHLMFHYSYFCILFFQAKRTNMKDLDLRLESLIVLDSGRAFQFQAWRPDQFECFGFMSSWLNQLDQFQLFRVLLSHRGYSVFQMNTRIKKWKLKSHFHLVIRRLFWDLHEELVKEIIRKKILIWELKIKKLCWSELSTFNDEYQMVLSSQLPQL